MKSFHRNGTHADRAKKSERISQVVQTQRRKVVEGKTHAMITDFERHLKSFQSATPEVDEDNMPLDASARTMRQTTNTFDAGSDSSDSPRMTQSQKMTMTKSASDSQVIRGHMLGDSEHLHAKRPPSPLSYYDYGCISMKPRSALSQLQRTGKGDEPLNGTQSMKRAQSSGGCYFPGPDYKQGPYGFSMQDPILFGNRSWETSRAPQGSSHHTKTNTRPRNTKAANDGGERSAPHMSRPTVPDCVRSTRGHDLKLQYTFQNLDRARDEANMDNARHEEGSLGGRWCHAVTRPGTGTDTRPGTSESMVSEPPHSWMEQDQSDMGGAAVLASRILAGMTRALNENHSTIPQLFNSVNHGTKAVLELEEFIEGLVRIQALDDADAVSLKVLAEAMSLIDPEFDGRVNYPALSRGVAASQTVQRKKAQGNGGTAGRGPKATGAFYGGELPIEVVKVDKNSKSVFDFNRSRDMFFKQQAALLAFHGERKD